MVGQQLRGWACPGLRALCPGHGHARHGVDHGALQLGLAVVRLVPEVLSSSPMRRRFSCSSKNKSRRVASAVTARFHLFFHLSQFLVQVDLGAPQAGPSIGSSRCTALGERPAYHLGSASRLQPQGAAQSQVGMATKWV